MNAFYGRSKSFYQVRRPCLQSHHRWIGRKPGSLTIRIHGQERQHRHSIPDQLLLETHLGQQIQIRTLPIRICCTQVQHRTLHFRMAIEIEANYQALQDCLLKDKLNTHHSRWMEYILSYNIIDIPHRQGIENPVTDGLSRMWRNRKRTQNDGSTWSVLPYWEASKRHRKSYRTMSTPRDIFWKPHSKVTYSSLLS